MYKFSLKSVAVAAITALLLAILAVPVMAAAEAPVAGSGGSTITAKSSTAFAPYTKRRAKKVRRRVRRHRRRVVRRHRHTKKRATVVTTAPAAPLATPAPAQPAPPAADETALAQTILDGLKAQYPRYLGNATVEFGDARGYQAISYYTIGRIVISSTHTATVQRIMEHEVWHVIDWQDNNTIDWGEAIPPANMAQYAD